MMRIQSWFRVCPRFAATVLGLIMMMLAAPRSNAAVALLMEQPYGRLGIVDPAGHSAIYLDHVCAETPVQLRPCRPGELGVVISRYDDISNHDWVAMPLIPYLYAVDSAEEIPDSVTKADVARLRESYRKRYLQMVAADTPTGGAPGGNWTQLAGSAFDRTIFGYQVTTTTEQDAHLIAVFNDKKNVQGYNGLYRNCADFARTTFNLYYPHAVRRNYVGDAGITSPKSVARSITHFAKKHPESEFNVFMVPQVKGELPRSHRSQDVTEAVLKRYGLPLTIVSPEATAVAVVAYLAHGRFDVPKVAPTLDVAQMEAAGRVEAAEVAPPISSKMPVVIAVSTTAPVGTPSGSKTVAAVAMLGLNPKP